MKLRCFYIFVLLILASPAKSQSEDIFLGTLIHAGYVDDAVYGPFNIGFNFTYYGSVKTQFYVSSNGLVSFVSDAGTASGTEAPIPTAATPNNFIAAFWDDLVVDGTGKISYTTIGAAPNRKLIIQFNNMGFYSFPAFMGSFSVILYETSNVIRVQYRLIVDNTSTRAHGGTATIGIENADGSAGVQYDYHSSSAVSTDKAITFTPSGSTYTLDADAIYEGIFLTSNLTLPEPGIPSLLSPPQNAVIGSDYNFSWSDAGNAASYTLLISTSSDLGGATYYPAGSNTSFDVTGLSLALTYYWGVFATNTTGTTWCEIKKFTTSSAPPLAAVLQNLWTEQLQDKTIKLNYTGGDASSKTAIITTLPAQGQLYQYNAGARGSQILSVPATVTDANRNIIYAATGTYGNGVGNFNFKIHDNSGDSPEATVTLNVSPPGVPDVLYVAKNTGVEIQFDLPMADPTGKQSQFTVTVNGTPAAPSAAGLKPGDPNAIVLTLTTPLNGTETVLVSYTQGDVTGSTGGIVFSFTDQPVSLRTQTITFPVIPVKQYGIAPFSPGATASSGLGITYSSSNLAVATSSGSTVTILSTGTSDIMARQSGNGTYAPAKYSRSLTVIKGDQTITFNALASKTYGDADFTLTASSSSGLAISYSGDNNSVATVTGNLVHIVGAGSVIITASQAGNSNYNPATDVLQTLTVSKADQTITFGSLPAKTFGDGDFSLTASASSGLSVSFSGNNNSVATVTGNLVHIVAAGSVIITASQTGNANYNAAPDVHQPLTVNKADQTITFSVLPVKTYGDADLAPAASASSGLSVGFSSDNNAVATIVGGQIHIVGAGSAVITAFQAGNNNYNAATNMHQTLYVNKAEQSITFSVLPDKTFGDAAFTPTVSASSGLSVSLASDNNSVAIIVSGQIHIVGAGSTVITAFQSGDANYNPAPDVQQTLMVNKADQTITFSVISGKTYGDGDFAAIASASSGLNVDLASDNPSVATITGNMIHVVSAGTATITASQTGNINYNPAPSVSQVLTVGKADLTFKAGNKSKPYLSGNPVLTFTMSGFVNGDTQVEVQPSIQTSAAIDSPVGDYPITLSGGSDHNYNFLFIAGTLTVTRLQQTITISDYPNRLLVGDTYTLIATSTSGLPVLFESSDNNITSINGDHMTGVSKGNANIHAYNSGDQNYEPADAYFIVEIYSTHKDIMHLFTPNNDGINDYWELPEMPTWGNCDVKVYSRNGKLVFSDPHYNNLWDGTSNGNPLPEGAYYFIIKTQNSGMVKGTVNIVR
jgi:gliding motility-associated-like protein